MTETPLYRSCPRRAPPFGAPATPDQQTPRLGHNDHNRTP